LDELGDKLGSLAGKWTTFAAFATFVVYLLGYLALRFQLSTYGVATNLDVWDERYLFAGSRFLVYLVSSVPNVLLIVFAFVAITYLPYKLVPAVVRGRMKQRFSAWAADPTGLPLLGTLLALGLIQFVLRKCFVFGNLLFAKELSGHEWINAILLTGDGNRSLYFSGLVGGTLLTGALLLFATRKGSASTSSLSKLLVSLLAFLVAVEFLLLPVNYGILIASQQLPRVSELGHDEKLANGEQAWLVWESKEAMVYFVREANGTRTMITIPRKESKVRIVAYDPIFRMLFGAATQGPRQASEEGNHHE
jgi:hypothetical protein